MILLAAGAKGVNCEKEQGKRNICTEGSIYLVGGEYNSAVRQQHSGEVRMWEQDALHEKSEIFEKLRRSDMV